jgi:hypothetical protein
MAPLDRRVTDRALRCRGPGLDIYASTLNMSILMHYLPQASLELATVFLSSPDNKPVGVNCVVNDHKSSCARKGSRPNMSWFCQ